MSRVHKKPRTEVNIAPSASALHRSFGEDNDANRASTQLFSAWVPRTASPNPMPGPPLGSASQSLEEGFAEPVVIDAPTLCTAVIQCTPSSVKLRAQAPHACKKCAYFKGVAVKIRGHQCPCDLDKLELPPHLKPRSVKELLTRYHHTVELPEWLA